MAMRQSFFSLAILASIFPGPALAQFKSWSKEQRTFEGPAVHVHDLGRPDEIQNGESGLHVPTRSAEKSTPARTLDGAAPIEVVL